MTLFELQDFWTFNLGQGNKEEYDFGCLAIGNLDNSVPPSDKIAVASLGGNLRIFNPNKKEYKVEDLLIEETLSEPILQLLCGRFIPSSMGMNGLAILHPRKLVVYELSPKGAKSGQASYYSLVKLYEHDLGMKGKHFTSYNMICGSFGGIKGKDLIMVQSMDGKWQFFEDSAIAFTTQLSDCLLPGPIAYLPRIDAFVTCTHACRAECYKYQVLVNAQNDNDIVNDKSYSKNGLVSIRSALVEWSLNIGEPCKQIVEGKFFNDDKKSSSELILLCEYTIFLVKDSGGIMQMRRLDRCPMCITSFIPHGSKISNFAIVNTDNTVQIFSEFSLIWAAKMQGNNVPVQLVICNLAKQKGLIASCDEEGLLKLNYLGTKPPVSNVSNYSRELDYDKIDEEHKSLLQTIRNSQNESKTDSYEKLVIKTQLGNSLERASSYGIELPSDVISLSTAFGFDKNGYNPFLKRSVKVFLSMAGNKSISNITLSVDAPTYLHVIPSSIHLEQLNASSQMNTPIVFDFYPTKSIFPTSITIQIVATYVNSKGEPQSSILSMVLPLVLCCRAKLPTKSATHKIVIDTNMKDPVLLTDLFDDFLLANSEYGLDLNELLGPTAPHALGFQFWNYDTIVKINPEGLTSSFQVPITGSILVSKSSGKYRIQSDSYSAAIFLTIQLEKKLVYKLTEKFAGNFQQNSLSYQDSLQLPLQEFFAAIKDHFDCRNVLISMMSKLNDESHQFRVINKRLLVRFKDRNPTALGGLDNIMKKTYLKIIELGDKIQEQQALLKKKSVTLNILGKGLVVLVSLKYNLSSLERLYLQQHFCTDLVEGNDQGWEETVEASLTFLLKTSLAKNYKETTTLQTNLELMSDIQGLKKLFTIVLDRISKGVRLVRENIPKDQR